MLNILTAFENRLAPAEEIFFRWLNRVVIAAALAGSAWLDDAPPLELAAYLVTLYVAGRVVMQFGTFYSVVPFENWFLKGFAALIALILLGLSYLTVAYFVLQLAALTVS